MAGWHFSWGLLLMKLLRVNKGYNGLNIFGLAIGIACAGLIFLWVQYELTFDNEHVNKSKLYEVKVTETQDGYTFTMGSTPRPMAATMKTDIPGIKQTARYLDFDSRMLVHTGGKSLYAMGRFCDPEVFQMFSFQFTAGDPAHPFPQLHSLVITSSEAKKLFGTDRGVINKVVRAEANFFGTSPAQDYVISGVVKDPLENSSLHFEYLAPYEIVNKLTSRPVELDWDSYGPLTYVELDPDADLAAINEQLLDYIHRKKADQHSKAFLYPMKKWRLYDEFANGKETGGGRIQEVRTLSVIAWIVLLIACINFMNLATATAQKRAKEVRVRKVLGVGRRGLIRQFMGESLLMSAIAGLLGLVMIRLTLPAFEELMGVQLQLRLADPIHVGGLLIIVLICGVVAGSYPAFYLSAFNPIGVLKGLKMNMSGAPMIRKGLVVVQFAVSVFFIISTLVVYLQIRHIHNRDLGLNQNRLIEVNPDRLVDGIFPMIKQELMKTGLIENVALADHQTLYGGETTDRYKWEGQSTVQRISIARRHVTAEYISTSGMKIVAGRDFRENDEAEASHVIVNESLARIMGPGNVVGKIIQVPHYPDGHIDDMTVVGVVRDYVYGDVHSGGAAPLILFRQRSDYQNFVYIRPKGQANLARVVAAIEGIMKKDNPGYPLEYKFVDEEFGNMYADDTQTSRVSAVFAVLAVLISCLGLFGLATFMSEQRSKEMGIRKVLGASVASMVALLTRGFVALVAVACLIAFPVAWWVMHHWLQDFEYRIDLKIWMFVVAGAAAVAIALVTIGSQAVRAGSANPVSSLRRE